MPGGGGWFSGRSEAQQEHAGRNIIEGARRMEDAASGFLVHFTSSHRYLHPKLRIQAAGRHRARYFHRRRHPPSSVIVAGQPLNGHWPGPHVQHPYGHEYIAALLLRHPSLKPEARSLESAESRVMSDE